MPKKNTDNNLVEELEKCRSQFQDLTDLMPDAILINVDGKFQFANPSAIKLFGARKLEDITRRDAFDFFHPDFHEQIRDRIKTVLAGGEVPKAVEKLLRLNGETVIAEVAAKLFNYQGKPSILVILHDVTETVKSIEEVGKAQKIYQDLVNNLPIGIYRNTPGPKGYFIEINPAMVKIFEAESKDQMMAIKISDLYQNAAERKKFSEELLKNGIVENRILALKTLKGRDIWGQVSAVVRYDEHGEVYFDGIFQDVTEAEAAKARYRQLIELSPDGVVVYSANGEILFVNKAGAEMFGAKDSSELIGKSGLVFVHGRSLADIKKKIIETLTKHQNFTAIFDAIRIDQRIITIEASGSYIDYEGQPAIHAVYRDISEREALNQKLKESEERYRKLVELIPEAIIVHKQGKVVYVNLAAVQLSGAQEPAQLIGKNVMDFIHPDARDLVRQRMASAYSGQKQEPALERLVKLDGSDYLAEVSSIPIFFANEPAGMVIVRDITEKKQIEETVANRTLELERLNKLMIGRELKMAELKQEIIDLKNKLKG